MNQNVIIPKLNSIFPGNFGIMITGSQVNKEVFSNTTDIDILVFDRYSSDIHSHGYQIGEFRLDCTVIPAFDFENAFLNEVEHERGILLTMVARGRYLDGNQQLIDYCIQLCTNYLKEEVHSVARLKTESAFELSKIGKYFQRELDDLERIILVSELVHTIGKLEAIRHENRDSNYLKRAIILREKNPGLVGDFKVIFDEVYNKKSTSVAVNYVAAYFNNLKLDVSVFPDSNICILDVNLGEITFDHFIKSIHPFLLQDECLHEAYLFAFRAPKKYHRLYKYDIVLCLSTKRFSSVVLMATIRQILSKIRNLTIDFRLCPFSGEIIVGIPVITHKLFLLAERLQVNKEVMIYLVLQIKKLLDLEISDTVNLNKILLQRWILKKEEQVNLRRHLDVYAIQQSRLQEYQNYYQENIAKIRNVFQQFRTGPGDWEDLNGQMMDLIHEIQLAIPQIADYVQKYKFNDILFEVLDIPNLERSKIYLYLVEEICKYLNLLDLNKALCIYQVTLELIEEGDGI